MSSLLSRAGRRLSEAASALFEPDLPRWACELTAREAVVVHCASDRRRILAAAAAPIADGAVRGDLQELNVRDAEAVGAALGRALEEAGFAGSEIVLVIPDEAVRVVLLTADTVPAGEAERLAFVRWKLRKSVPIDLQAARIACQKLAGDGGGVELMAVLSTHPVARQYEEIVESAGLHPGVVCPSTLAAMNLLDGIPGNVIFVKAGPESLATAIVAGGRFRFYRRVVRQRVYDAVHPTFMYYQDRMESGHPVYLAFCGDAEAGEACARAAQELSIPYVSLDAYSGAEDRFKPALGAMQR